MTVVAFAILFAGVVSSVLAGATTTLLLAFILPVSLPGPASPIPDRVAGLGPRGGGIAVRHLAAVAGAGAQPGARRRDRRLPRPRGSSALPRSRT